MQTIAPQITLMFLERSDEAEKLETQEKLKNVLVAEMEKNTSGRVWKHSGSIAAVLSSQVTESKNTLWMLQCAAVCFLLGPSFILLLKTGLRDKAARSFKI